MLFKKNNINTEVSAADPLPTEMGDPSETAYAGSGEAGSNSILRGLYSLIKGIQATFVGIIGNNVYLRDPATGAAVNMTASVKVYTTGPATRFNANSTPGVQVLSAPGSILGFFVQKKGSGTTNTFALYDALTKTGTPFLSIDTSTMNLGWNPLPIQCGVGLWTVLDGGTAADILLVVAG